METRRTFTDEERRAGREASHIRQRRQLAGLLEKWNKTGSRPSQLDVMSSGERAALLMAAGYDCEIASPVVTFLMLDSHLQRFVLEARGQFSLIGMQVGVD